MNGNIRIAWPFIIAIAVFSTGCSKNPNAPAKISGKITKNGSPVTAGTISFASESNGSVTVGIRSDGTYEATELPVGDFVVTIETESANPDNKKAQEYKGGGQDSNNSKYGVRYGPGGGGGMPKAKEHDTAAEVSPRPDSAPATSGSYVKISRKYADPTQSNLSVTLKRGSNKKDFDLTD